MGKHGGGNHEKRNKYLQTTYMTYTIAPPFLYSNSSEQKRMDLDRQLRVSLQAGQTSSKMKAARLHSYWKKICEDEKKAKLRNEALLREFERIDAHMYEMSARTQRLALMKKQYEDYISRTYPQWNELMYGKPQVHSPNERPAQAQHTPQSQQSTPSGPHEQIKTQVDVHHTPTTHPPVTATASSSSVQSISVSKPYQQQDDSPQPVISKEVISEDVKQADSYFGFQESGIYQNLPSARSESEQRLQHIDDIPSSARIESSSQPVQSIEIQSKKSGQTIQSSNYSMQPPPEEDEDDNSDLATDNEIPMAKSAMNTVVRADVDEKSKSATTKSHGIIRPELTIDGLLSLLRLVENDIADAFSLEGYYRSSWPDTSVKNDIIRKANGNGNLSRIDVNLISMVILEQITLIIRSLAEKCLIPESVLQRDTSTLTPQKLSQHLSPEAQLVWNALFAHFVKLVRSQVMKSYELSAIFTPCMVSDNASQDKAHTFVVQLLENLESPDEGKMVLQSTGKSMSPAGTMEGSGSFADDGRVPRLKFGSLLEKPMSDDDSSFITSLPRDSVPLNETAAYKSMISTGGSDPPRRQSSAQEDTDDDVEKQIATALSQPAVVHQSPRKKIEADEPSETSSQTLQTTSHVYVPTALETKSPRQPAISPQRKIQGVKISSDLDTDTEVDAGIFGSSRRAEDNFDFDFYD